MTVRPIRSKRRPMHSAGRPPGRGLSEKESMWDTDNKYHNKDASTEKLMRWYVRERLNSTIAETPEPEDETEHETNDRYEREGEDEVNERNKVSEETNEAER